MNVIFCKRQSKFTTPPFVSFCAVAKRDLFCAIVVSIGTIHGRAHAWSRDSQTGNNSNSSDIDSVAASIPAGIGMGTKNLSVYGSLQPVKKKPSAAGLREETGNPRSDHVHSSPPFRKRRSIEWLLRPSDGDIHNGTARYRDRQTGQAVHSFSGVCFEKTCFSFAKARLSSRSFFI